MEQQKTVILDPGHGGVEPGAIYEERKEKDDTLRLALAVGRILERNGVNVLLTRVRDVYDSPYEKAEIANRSGADLFVSLHRNAMPQPNTASGVQSLVYEDSGIRHLLAKNINESLSGLTGYANLGIQERPG
ncbi:MAG: N-acetylmuramoyl-L-alanine amidase family protein, partial [Lachnospiraceae bacterium]